MSDLHSRWYDRDDASIVVCIDRVALTLTLDEFLDFYDTIHDIKEELLSDSDICIGTYEEDGKIKRQLILIPETEDLN